MPVQLSASNCLLCSGLSANSDSKIAVLEWREVPQLTPPKGLLGPVRQRIDDGEAWDMETSETLGTSDLSGALLSQKLPTSWQCGPKKKQSLVFLHKS